MWDGLASREQGAADILEQDGIGPETDVSIQWSLIAVNSIVAVAYVIAVKRLIKTQNLSSIA